MKRLLFLFLAFSTGLFAQNQVLTVGKTGHLKNDQQLIHQRDGETTIRFNLNELDLIEVDTDYGKAFVVTSDKAPPMLEKGSPEIFHLTSSFIIPDTGGSELEIAYGTFTDFENIEIAPSKGNLPRSINPQTVPFVKGEVYLKDGFYPGTMANLREPFIIRDIRGQSVDVYPVQYNPVTKVLRVYSEITITVKNTGKAGVNEFTNQKRHKTVDPQFNQIYGDMFINHSEVRQQRAFPTGEDGELLIICHPAFMDAMKPYVDWKRTIGRKTTLVSTAAVTPSLTAANLKTYIANYYNNPANNLAYVLLVGDVAQIPVHVLSISGETTPTDNHLGQIAGGPYLDVLIARMSAESVTHVQTQVQRSIWYERDITTSDTWLSTGWGGAARECGGHFSECDDEHMDVIRTRMLNYGYNPVYQAYTGAPGITNATQASITQQFNNGVGLANYCNHGSMNAWTYYHGLTYSSTQVNALTNQGKLPYIFSVACNNGEFNSGTCFAEAWMRATQGGQPTGAVATLMATISIGWTPPMAAQDVFVNIALDLDQPYNYASSGAHPGVKRTFAGAALNGTQKMMAIHGTTGKTYADFLSWTVFGDPTLQYRTRTPQVMTISHLPVLLIGMNDFTVSCDAEGAFATLSYIDTNNEVIILGSAVVTGGSANILMNNPPTVPMDLTLAVTGFNKVTYLSTIEVIPPDGPYIVSGGYNVVGEPELTYISTNSQIAVILKNVGIDPTEGALNVAIACSDPQLTINSATAQCGIINAGASTTVNFNVTVANNIPDNKTFPVTVTITDIDNTTWVSNLSLKAYAPDFSLEKVLVNGVENGNMAPGIVTLTLLVKNKGNADAYAVTGDITTSSTFITPACEGLSAAIQDLPAGETMELTFIMVADQSMPFGHNANFNLSLTADYGRTHTAPFTTSYTGSSNHCVPGNTNCGSSDRFTLVRLVKTSAPTVNLINNTDGTCVSGGYSNLTNTAATLTPGEQYTITVTIAFGTNTVRGWFDLNGNNVFEDSERLININYPTANAQVSQTFTVPANAQPGSYRFRLRTRYSGTPEPCDGYTYGQTHDYTVVIPELYPRVQNVVAALSGTSINITWDAPSGQTPEGYNIYRGGNLLNTALLTNPSYTESGLTEGVYVYNVTAVFAGNKESLAQMSNVICLQGDELPCEIPVNLSGIKEVNTAVISWDEPQNMTGTLVKYNVYRNTTNIGETLPTARTYSDANLANGTYTYQVSAVYEECESALTSGVTIVIEAYAVNYNTPENGTLSVTGTAAIASGALVNANTVITITATPVNAERYRLGTLTVNGSNFTSGNNHTVTGVTTINCSFVGIDPTLTAMTINDNQTINVSNNMFHMAACGKANVVLSNLASEGTIRIGGNVYVPGMTVPFVDDKVVINIHITGVTDMNYTILVTKALGSAAMPMYIQRWGKVLAVVNNPDRNGGHTFDNYRWYLNGIPQQSATGGYILLDGRQSTSYAAEVHSVKTSEWHKLCHNVIIGQNQSAITVYPNPVEAGGLLSLNLPEDVDKVNVNIYDISGNLVRQQKGVHSAVTMPSQTGMYIVEIQLPDGTSNTQQVIVK